jgi:hypothetical protein
MRWVFSDSKHADGEVWPLHIMFLISYAKKVWNFKTFTFMVVRQSKYIDIFSYCISYPEDGGRGFLRNIDIHTCVRICRESLWIKLKSLIDSIQETWKTIFGNGEAVTCRSEWPRCLRNEPSSFARTLGPWVWIPLKAWMSVCVYSVFVLFCMQPAALRRADPSSKESYRQYIGLRN